MRYIQFRKDEIPLLKAIEAHFKVKFLSVHDTADGFEVRTMAYGFHNELDLLVKYQRKLMEEDGKYSI